MDSFGKVGKVADSGKPETVEFYNKTKSGVDMMDRKVRTFSTKRKCRRWPYSFVMNIVDIAVCNSSIIFGTVHQLSNQQKKSHHLQFLIKCGYQMVDQQLSRRALTKAAQQPLVKSALSQLGFSDKTFPTGSISSASMDPYRLEKSQRCYLCPREADKKTRAGCSVCHRPICVAHKSNKCSECI